MGLIGPPVGVLMADTPLAALPIGLSHSCLRLWGASVFISGDPPAALERIADSALALRAVALLFLPLQKLAKQRLALLRGKIRGWRTFILQERGKIAVGPPHPLGEYVVTSPPRQPSGSSREPSRQD